jgi:hypothetical protein
MKLPTLWLSVLALVSITLTGAPNLAQEKVNENEATEIGIEAYVYGYPLVTMDMTRRVMTNVAAPEGTHAPMGQFLLMPRYPDASFKDVTAPNADTLYSTAWLDLAKEPYVLSLPDMGDRYFLMPMLSGWTDVFAVPGKRTTGTKAQTYAITGPNWKGKLPEGVKQLKAPTNMVWILGRTYCTGTPEDYRACHAIMDKRRVLTNTTDRLMLVFTEPEAQDYWLRPGESVEVRAEVASPGDDFELEDTPYGVTVWPSRGMGYISTWAGGVELVCGHQRLAGWA